MPPTLYPTTHNVIPNAPNFIPNNPQPYTQQPTMLYLITNSLVPSPPQAFTRLSPILLNRIPNKKRYTKQGITSNT